jgi:outer membrane receptor protein involved in Fe transport
MLAFNHQYNHGGIISAHFRHESQDVLQQFGRPLEGFDSSVEFFQNDEGEIEVVVPRREDVRSGLKVKRNSLNISANDWTLDDWTVNAHLQMDQYKADSLIRYPIIEDFIVEIDDETIGIDDLNETLLENDEFRALLVEGLDSVVVDTENISFEQGSFKYDTQFYSAEVTISKQVEFDSFTFEQLYGTNWNRSEPETLVWQTHDTRSNFIPVEQTELLFSANSTNNNVRDENIGVFAQWVVNWRYLTLFLGARVDYLDFKSQNLGIDVKDSFVEPTFRVGVVSKVNDTTSLFANYSETFSPQFDLIEIFEPQINTDNEDGIFTIQFPQPADSVQLEAGIKKLWLSNQLQTSCALYRIEKDNIDSAIIRQRNQGLECDATGSLGRGWQLTFGLSYLDAEIVESFEEDFIGKRPRISPEYSARLWLNKDIHISENWHSRFGLGLTYVDERFIDANNEDPLKAYQLADVSLALDYKNRLKLSFNVRNLFDEEYTLGVFNALPFWTNPGLGRVLETQLVYRF